MSSLFDPIHTRHLHRSACNKGVEIIYEQCHERQKYEHEEQHFQEFRKYAVKNPEHNQYDGCHSHSLETVADICQIQVVEPIYDEK